MFHHDSFIGENDCSKEFAEKVMRKSLFFCYSFSYFLFARIQFSDYYRDYKFIMLLMF